MKTKLKGMEEVKRMERKGDEEVRKGGGAWTEK